MVRGWFSHLWFISVRENSRLTENYAVGINPLMAAVNG